MRGEVELEAHWGAGGGQQGELRAEMREGDAERGEVSGADVVGRGGGGDVADLYSGTGRPGGGRGVR